VNNVGTNIRKPSVEFSESDFSTIFSTNLESAFALSQQFHPLLKAAGSSVLLFNSSVAGEYRLCRQDLSSAGFAGWVGVGGSVLIKVLLVLWGRMAKQHSTMLVGGDSKPLQ
jgi:hypothetical protein